MKATLDLTQKPCRRGILSKLREKYPQKKWKAVREGFGWAYVTEDGWHAGWRSCINPDYGFDDDLASVSRFFIYKPNEGPEEVWFD